MNKNKILVKKFEPVDLNKLETIDLILDRVKKSNVINFMLYVPTYGTWTHPIQKLNRYHFPVLVPNKHIVAAPTTDFPEIRFDELKCESSYEAIDVAKKIHAILLEKWQKHVQNAFEIAKAKDIMQEEVSPNEELDDQSN